MLQMFNVELRAYALQIVRDADLRPVRMIFAKVQLQSKMKTVFGSFCYLLLSS